MIVSMDFEDDVYYISENVVSVNGKDDTLKSGKVFDVKFEVYLEN